MHIISVSSGIGPCVMLARNNLQAVACFPFDMARENYAKGVRVGVIEQSLLASAKFGQSLHTLEILTLGPLARSR